jgi:hypothetical protein
VVTRELFEDTMSRKSEEFRYKIPLAQKLILYFVNANQNRRRGGNLPSRSVTDVVVVSPPSAFIPAASSYCSVEVSQGWRMQPSDNYNAVPNTQERGQALNVMKVAGWLHSN